jgi:hypothetical protein
VSATLDKIIEEVRTLTPEERQQLLELLEHETHGSEQSRRDALSRTIRGKYRDVLSSSEEFIARKAAETAREDRAR